LGRTQHSRFIKLTCLFSVTFPLLSGLLKAGALFSYTFPHQSFNS
jgi:hypothetical protein